MRYLDAILERREWICRQKVEGWSSKITVWLRALIEYYRSHIKYGHKTFKTTSQCHGGRKVPIETDTYFLKKNQSVFIHLRSWLTTSRNGLEGGGERVTTFQYWGRNVADLLHTLSTWQRATNNRLRNSTPSHDFIQQTLDTTLSEKHPTTKFRNHTGEIGVTPGCHSRC